MGYNLSRIPINVSAICGVFHIDGHEGVRHEIAAMTAALAHRGVDRHGVWCDDLVGLAHRMSFTTPESLTEHQPVVRSNPAHVLVADARIDNRDELLRAIDAPRGRAASDSEIILTAYHHWGARCVEHLIGDFAFAIWDVRERSLFCARDPIGVKPLYYLHNERVFAFASELKALLTLPGVTPIVDPEEVALFVGWRHEERTRTIYRDLTRLPAAHTLLVTPDRSAKGTYWSADFARDIRFARDDQYSAAFREIFATAVEARLRCAFPVGSTLSGGLDSSSVACMSRQRRGENPTTSLHTFSVIFPSLPQQELRGIDERSFVDAVLEQGGFEPHFIRGDESSPLRDLSRVLWHLDEPFFAPNLYLHWAIYEAAQDSGVRVLLDGFDGDSVVSHGFDRLTSLARSRQWETLEAEIRAFSAHHDKEPRLALEAYVLPHLAQLARGGRWLTWARTARELGNRFNLSFTKLGTTHGLRPLLPRAIGTRVQAICDRGSSGSVLLQPNLARALRRQTRMAADGDLPLPSERAQHLRGLSQPVYQLALEMADKSAAAFCVEPRYPFFDRRMIEFCLGLPEEQKFATGWPRLILRRAMEGSLPPSVQWRSSKANLSPNFHRRFRAVDLPMADALNHGRLSPYIRSERLRHMLNGYRASNDPAMKKQGLALFRTIVLGSWLNGLSDDRDPKSGSTTALSTTAA